LRLAIARQRGGEIVERGKVAECRCVTTPVEEVCRGDGAARIVGARFPHHHHTIRICIRQRLQHAAVQHREDRGVGADAERQRANRRERQQGMAEAEP
jgi:hypothetical protein